MRDLRATMELAREEPIACTAFGGQQSYRLSLAPVRTGASSAALLGAFRGERSASHHSVSSSIDSKLRSLLQTAQAMRASLLARATAALLWPRAHWRSRAQTWRWLGCPRLLAAQRTERAPWMRSIRRYGSPRFEIEPSRRMSPLECSRGVSPRKLAKWRPEGKRWMSPMKATRAVAVRMPIPGTVRRCRMTGSSAARDSIS